MHLQTHSFGFLLFFNQFDPFVCFGAKELHSARMLVYFSAYVQLLYVWPVMLYITLSLARRCAQRRPCSLCYWPSMVQSDPFFIFYSYRSPYRLAAKWKRTQDSSCVGEQTPYFLMWPIRRPTAWARVSHTVRHCVCLWSHFSWAHIPWGIHTLRTHNPTGGESECSPVCPDRRRHIDICKCFLTHRPPPLAHTSWQCRFICKP